jgi:hypothetical protein
VIIDLLYHPDLKKGFALFSVVGRMIVKMIINKNPISGKLPDLRNYLYHLVKMIWE